MASPTVPDWPKFMTLACVAGGSVVVYLYLTGKLSLGPGGREWEGVLTSTTNTSMCPPPECDCTMLRGRIAYLDRKLHDTENALLKAEGLYASLYTKFTQKLQELEEWKARAQTAEAEVELLKARLAQALAELDVCLREFDALKSQCIERDLQVNACSAGLSVPGLLR